MFRQVGRRAVTRYGHDFLRAKRINFYRIGNILQRLFATILKRIGKFRAHVLVDRGGDADAARLRQRLEACGDVDTVPLDIVIVGDDIPEIDADTPVDALRLREFDVPLSHRLLQCYGAGHCLHCARELHQNTVAFDFGQSARREP